MRIQNGKITETYVFKSIVFDTEKDYNEYVNSIKKDFEITSCQKQKSGTVKVNIKMQYNKNPLKKSKQKGE